MCLVESGLVSAWHPLELQSHLSGLVGSDRAELTQGEHPQPEVFHGHNPAGVVGNLVHM